MASGWITLNRAVKDHWIYSNNEYFSAWVKMILIVNHDHDKVLIKGKLVECKRGQSVRALSTWVKDFGKGWSVQRVRTFFKLLEDDKMIVTESVQISTRVTICNYGTYQAKQQASNKQATSKQQASNKQPTTNNNVNNEKENIYADFLARFNKATGRRIRIIDEKTKRQLNARLKDGFTLDEIITAAESCSNDKYHKENKKYLTPEFITRADKLQIYMNESSPSYLWKTDGQNMYGQEVCNGLTIKEHLEKFGRLS